ncbi:putative transcriptional regulator, TetR family [Nocardia nova SH22a]|uniref:Putative transcriptional regulator, TetR family n=1 Tax=Nocardia nova SH22a TaxID=1415166 RepID=W5TC53_9NOCA|nr:TetR/AcrR family transcriptional regulator [Nocardia nova]AHH16817.1 putative transcriptional regulator, TetR family [Nocardia nova SH22a]
MPTDAVDWLAGGVRRTVARERIESAAAELFLERGIDRVGVDDVAARAGCSRATVYRHVGGKPELVRTVMSSAARDFAERVAARVAPLHGPRRAVEAVLTSVTIIRREPVLAAFLADAGTAGDHVVATPELRAIATVLTGVEGDDEAAEWIVRVVLSLLTWPLADAAAERRMVERFVAPLARPGVAARGTR